MSIKICGSLNNGCQFLGLDGYCSAPDLFCEKKCDDKIFIYSYNHNKHEIVLSMMRNLRTLHQENMELKQLLLELKQNQK